MTKLLKYFKPFALLVALTFILQFVRAEGSLELPSYTSQIVDVGVSNYGVENYAPDFIRTSTLNTILNLSDEPTQQLIQNNYVAVDSNNMKKYANIGTVNETDPVLMLNTKDSAVIDDLSEAFEPFMLMNGVNSYAELNNIDLSTTQSGDFDINSVPPHVIEQIAVLGVQAELTASGVDIEDYQRAYILNIGGMMILFAFIVLISVIISYYCVAYVTSSVTAKIREDLYAKVLSFSNKEFDKFSTSSLITRLTNDLQQVNQAFSMLLQIAVYAPILAISGIMRSYGAATNMLLITLTAVVILMGVISMVIFIAVPKFKIIQQTIDKLNLVARETINGIMVIRSFSNEKLQENKFDEVNKDLTKTSLMIGRIMSSVFPCVMAIMNLASVAIIWFGGKNVEAGIMQAGDIMAYIQYTTIIIFSFLMFSMIIFIVPRAQVAAKRITEVLDTEPTIETPQNPKELQADKRAVIEFKNVSFKYTDDKEAEYVLENVSFTARPNQTTAIIGSTGSGKSTIVNLIPRFYDITEGEILLSGTNIKDIDLKTLRDQIGLVPQKGLLFTGTIASNIKYGSDISDEFMKKCADIAQATDFIMNKEEGFDTPIAQGGKNVSGGQKQRLSIARALAKESEVLIFDDSFSALDYKTDAVLRKQLFAEVKDTTCIVVAQRINTIRNSEQIIVLDAGLVVGIGTHNELIDNCTVYREIALSQIPKEELYNE